MIPVGLAGEATYETASPGSPAGSPATTLLEPFSLGSSPSTLCMETPREEAGGQASRCPLTIVTKLPEDPPIPPLCAEPGAGGAMEKSCGELEYFLSPGFMSGKTLSRHQICLVLIHSVTEPRARPPLSPASQNASSQSGMRKTQALAVKSVA